MGTRTRSTHLWFLFCLAGFLSLSFLPSGRTICTTVFLVLVMDILKVKDEAVFIWENLREIFCQCIVVLDLLVEIDSLSQGERTVEEYCQEFVVRWKELETLRPLPVCTCGAKCRFCSDAVRGERKRRMELKLLRFLKGLNDDRSRIISMHQCCLRLKVSDKEGSVILNLCETVPTECKICKGKKVKSSKGWPCVSSDENFCFHAPCFKGLVLDKGKEDHFSKDKRGPGKKQREMDKAGRSSEGSGKKIKAFNTKIAIVALKLIGSVIAPLILGAVSGY